MKLPVFPTTLPAACSVGIMAHNEAGNIRAAIRSILRQAPASCRIEELLVVASGCTDDTVRIASEVASRDPRVRVIVQDRREGKASAINLFLEAARSPVVVIAGADVLVKEGSLQAMLAHFANPTVGMVGAHPIPVNDEASFLGYTVHLVWRIHDLIARGAPKLGEVIALRKAFDAIPVDSAVDEVSMQALFQQLGYQMVYEPEAIVYNRGPETLADFLRQRRRIHAGHLKVRRQEAYAAPTMSLFRVAPALLGAATIRRPFWTLGAVALEAWARILGRYDYVRGRSHHKWQLVATTKSGILEGSRDGRESVLVFRLIGYHQLELELGTRRGRLLQQHLLEEVRSWLQSATSVEMAGGGTLIARAALDRESAEQAANDVISRAETVPFRVDGRGEVRMRLTCGIVSFPQSGQPIALALPATA